MESIGALQRDDHVRMTITRGETRPIGEPIRVPIGGLLYTTFKASCIVSVCGLYNTVSPLSVLLRELWWLVLELLAVVSSL